MEQQASTRVFKPVPFINAWALPGTKLDLKAIYRRPSRSTGEFDEVVQNVADDGLPAYDLTGPLPVRRHTDWLAKGYEYVTLADKESLDLAAPSLRENGFTPSDYLQHPHFGPWNPKLYAKTAATADREKFDSLVAQIKKFGIKAVEEIRGLPIPPAVKAALEKQGLAGNVTLPHAGATGEGSAAPVTTKRAAAKKPARTKKATPPAQDPTE